MSLSPKHERASAPIPLHPYRNSALTYGLLSLVIVALAALTGGALGKAVVVAIGFFFVATGWAWLRFRRRLEEQARLDARKDDP